MSVHSELFDQYEVAMERKNHPSSEKSYTRYLYEQGLDKILKKCGEETFEAVIAAKGTDMADTVGELNDVLYHVTVLLCLQGVRWDSVLAALNTRCSSQWKTIDELFEVIAARRTSEEEGSYTRYLFEQGMDKILKKVGEACSLFIIAAKNGDSAAVASETADLLYHLMCMMLCGNIPLSALEEELVRRSEKKNNLKTFHTTNVNS